MKEKAKQKKPYVNAEGIINEKYKLFPHQKEAVLRILADLRKSCENKNK